MAISKERKIDLLNQYRDLLKSSSGIVLASYSGLRVREMQDLRRNIREAGGEFHVIKNRLVRLAFMEKGLPIPDEGLNGAIAIGFAYDDIPGVVKAIVNLARESDSAEIKGAVLNGVVYDSKQVKRIADLPPMPMLRAQLLGVIQAPATRIAGALAGSVRQVVNVIHAYSETQTSAAA